MPCYVCDRCKTIDNTAVPGSNFWDVKAFRKNVPPAGEVLCSACNTGHWHGLFPRREFDPCRDSPKDFIYVNTKYLPDETQVKISTLAAAIADELMSFEGGDAPVERLVLMQRVPGSTSIPAQERDMGGRCRDSVIKAIASVLKSHYP